jgi:prevent-host-death family protein
MESVRRCTVLKVMSRIKRKGAEEARKQLPKLLAEAEKGRTTIITRHGRPIAALVPIDEFLRSQQPLSLLPLEGSGHGFWGNDIAHTIDALRNEWDR